MEIQSFQMHIIQKQTGQISEIHILEENFTLEKSALTLHLCFSQLVKLAKRRERRSTSARDGAFLKRSKTCFTITYADNSHSNEPMQKYSCLMIISF